MIYSIIGSIDARIIPSDKTVEFHGCESCDDHMCPSNSTLLSLGTRIQYIVRI